MIKKFENFNYLRQVSYNQFVYYQLRKDDFFTNKELDFFKDLITKNKLKIYSSQFLKIDEKVFGVFIELYQVNSDELLSIEICKKDDEWFTIHVNKDNFTDDLDSSEKYFIADQFQEVKSYLSRIIYLCDHFLVNKDKHFNNPSN